MSNHPIGRVGREFIYFDKLSEERFNVECIGYDPPDDLGLVFFYYRAIDDNGSKNDKVHPEHGKYWLILEANDPCILDPYDVDKMIDNVENFMDYYKKD